MENKAEEGSIQKLCKEVTDLFQAELPQDYIAFLKECDGFEFNGHILYGTRDFVGNNLDWSDCSDEYLYLAEYDIGWFVMKKEDGTFWEPDKPSGEEQEQFATAVELIKYAVLHCVQCA